MKTSECCLISTSCLHFFIVLMQLKSKQEVARQKEAERAAQLRSQFQPIRSVETESSQAGTAPSSGITAPAIPGAHSQTSMYSDNEVHIIVFREIFSWIAGFS